MDAQAAAALREKFPPATIGKLPRAGITLDYVGHAAVTDRLLAVDPCWTWEPFAVDEKGLPAVIYGEKEAALWIRLTVCGVTRVGVGTAGKGSFELHKQLISDALRNAAMRFGVALDLWSKEELSASPSTGWGDDGNGAGAPGPSAGGVRPSPPASSAGGDGAPATVPPAVSSSDVEPASHGTAPSDGPPEVPPPPLPASGGPPTCVTCGEPVVGDVMKKDGQYAHKACGFKVPEGHPLNEARSKL